MIYRYHVYEELGQKYWLAAKPYKSALGSLLVGFPEQLLLLLDDAEIHNEIVDLEKQEVYLKITTEIEEQAVSTAVADMLKMTGLHGTRLNPTPTTI